MRRHCTLEVAAATFLLASVVLTAVRADVLPTSSTKSSGISPTPVASAFAIPGKSLKIPVKLIVGGFIVGLVLIILLCLLFRYIRRRIVRSRKVTGFQDLESRPTPHVNEGAPWDIARAATQNNHEPSNSSQRFTLVGEKVVLVGPDPQQEIVRAQQERMLEKVAARHAAHADASANAQASQPMSLANSDIPGERDVLRAQVNILQQQMEEMKAGQVMVQEPGELPPPAYEGSRRS